MNVERAAEAVLAGIDDGSLGYGPDRDVAREALGWLVTQAAHLDRDGLGPAPSDAGGPGHEEQYWQRRKLDAAIRHLRDIEDYYRTRGGLPEGFNMIRADRARAIYEQISDDYLNGNAKRPTLAQRLDAAEGALREIANAACRVFPNPPPTLEDGLVTFPSNCITRKRVWSSVCAPCRARAVLDVV